MVSNILAIVIAYLLGSIPSAYLVTRLFAGRDIRQLGGGNVGGLNVLKEVGGRAGVLVAAIDVSKGAAAVAIARWLLDLTPLFVMLTGLAVVVGHNWMVFLKFSGGKGMGATVGALAVVMPAYGATIELLIFIAAVAVILAITRNIALSMGIGLVFLPVIVWFGTHSGIGTLMASILSLIIAYKFFPTARAAWKKSDSKKEFIFDNSVKKKKVVT